MMLPFSLPSMADDRVPARDPLARLHLLASCRRRRALSGASFLVEPGTPWDLVWCPHDSDELEKRSLLFCK